MIRYNGAVEPTGSQEERTMAGSPRWRLVDEETLDALRAARPLRGAARLLSAGAVGVTLSGPMVACNVKGGHTGKYPESGDTSDTGDTGDTGDSGDTGDTSDSGDTGDTAAPALAPAGGECPVAEPALDPECPV